MKSVRHLDVSAEELADGLVIMVDTDNNRTYKFIIERGKDPVGISNAIFSELFEDQGEETDGRRVILGSIKVGSPIEIVTAPLKKSSKGPLGMQNIVTDPVVGIEVYE